MQARCSIAVGPGMCLLIDWEELFAKEAVESHTLRVLSVSCVSAHILDKRTLLQTHTATNTHAATD